MRIFRSITAIILKEDPLERGIIEILTGELHHSRTLEAPLGFVHDLDILVYVIVYTVRLESGGIDVLGKENIIEDDDVVKLMNKCSESLESALRTSLVVE